MKLDDYRLLGRSGLRVSPLCVGTMTFGQEWGFGSDADESRRVFDLYTTRGGNFLDTANFYTNGTSETMLGGFLQGRRDQFVLATKFSLTIRRGNPNAAGNHRKCIAQSLDASLKRLRTDYIDLYWLHAWDGFTPIDEIMRALDDEVRRGRVLYIGVSNMPAWRIARANTLAELMGWSRFIGLQIEYSLIERAVERELIPMAMELGLGVTPWSPLGGGVLTGKYRSTQDEPRRYRRDEGWGAQKLREHNLQIADEVVAVAREAQCSPARLALRWVLDQPGVVSPIVGARTAAQLDDNLASLDLAITPDHRRRLDEASRIDLGYPHTFLADPSLRDNLTGGTRVSSS